jgi:hypothetical protein
MLVPAASCDWKESAFISAASDGVSASIADLAFETSSS